MERLHQEGFVTFSRPNIESSLHCDVLVGNCIEYGTFQLKKTPTRTKCQRMHRDRQRDQNENSRESTGELSTIECRTTLSETANHVLNELECSIGNVLGHVQHDR